MVAGVLSGLAVLLILLVRTLLSWILDTLWKGTIDTAMQAMVFRVPAFTMNVMPYFVSLLVANLLQASGAMINAKWISDLAVEPGMLCSLQGGLKQAGNVGTAVWYASALPSESRQTN